MEIKYYNDQKPTTYYVGAGTASITEEKGVTFETAGLLICSALMIKQNDKTLFAHVNAKMNEDDLQEAIAQHFDLNADMTCSYARAANYDFSKNESFKGTLDTEAKILRVMQNLGKEAVCFGQASSTSEKISTQTLANRNHSLS